LTPAGPVREACLAAVRDSRRPQARRIPSPGRRPALPALGRVRQLEKFAQAGGGAAHFRRQLRESGINFVKLGFGRKLFWINLHLQIVDKVPPKAIDLYLSECYEQ
jgi:hypothetical protein